MILTDIELVDSLEIVLRVINNNLYSLGFDPLVSEEGTPLEREFCDHELTSWIKKRRDHMCFAIRYFESLVTEYGLRFKHPPPRHILNNLKYLQEVYVDYNRKQLKIEKLPHWLETDNDVITVCSDDNLTHQERYLARKNRIYTQCQT